MKSIINICLLFFSVFAFSCVSTPKSTTKTTTVELDVEVKIKELKDKIAKYELEIYDIENFNIAEAEYNKASDILNKSADGKMDKSTKAELDNSLSKAYEHYKLVVNNGMPLYAKSKRTSALTERDKANSIISHRTANPEYEGAALVFLKGEDEMLLENYETAATDYTEARIGYEKSYNMARKYYDRSSNSIKELDKVLKEIDDIQTEIDSYQVSK